MLNTILEQLLLEATTQEIFDKYYSKAPFNLTKEKFDELIRLDPTFSEEHDKMGNYGKWILERYRQGNLPEDLHSVIEVLNDFNSRKQYLNNEESRGEANKGSDINRYKSIQEIRDALNCIILTDSQRARQARKTKQYADLGSDAIFIGENDNWEIWRPLTYAADAKLGEGSSWCTASSSGEDSGRGPHSGYFYSYTIGRNSVDNSSYNSHVWHPYSDDGKLYVFLNKTDKHQKYQIRVSDETNRVTDCMNIDDNHVDFKKVVSITDTLDVLLNSELSRVQDIQNIKEYIDNQKKILNKIEETGILIINDADDLYHPDREINVYFSSDINSSSVFILSSLLQHNEHIHTIKLFGDDSYSLKNIIYAISQSNIYINVNTLDASEYIRETITSNDTSYIKNNTDKLKHFILPNTLKNIDANTFIYLIGIKELVLPPSVEYIGLNAFGNNDIKLIKQPKQKIRVPKIYAQFIKDHLVIDNKEEVAIETNESLELKEDLSPSTPDWIRLFIERGNKKELSKEDFINLGIYSEDELNSITRVTGGMGLKNNLINPNYTDKSLDISSVKYIVPETKPTSGNSKYFKPPYIGIFFDTMIYNHVLYYDTMVYDANNDRNYGGGAVRVCRQPWDRQYMYESSKKALMDNCVRWAFIDTSDPENANIITTQKHIDRLKSRVGTVSRVQPSSDDLSKAKDLMNTKGNAQSYVDASGYLVEPLNLYKKLYDLKKSHYAIELKKIYNLVKDCRKRLIDNIQQQDVKHKMYQDNTNTIISKYSEILEMYRDIISKIESINKENKQAILSTIFEYQYGRLYRLYNMIKSFNKLCDENETEVVETLQEANQGLIDKFKSWAGEELADRFLSTKDTLKGNLGELKDMGYWMNNSDPKGLEDFLNDKNNYSPRALDREHIENGAQKIFENEEWKVYHVTSYEAAKVLGRHTKWCIAGTHTYKYGPYPGKTGKDVFNLYNTTYKFFINKKTGKKYCIGVNPYTNKIQTFDELDFMIPEVPNAPTGEGLETRSDSNIHIINMVAKIIGVDASEIYGVVDYFDDESPMGKTDEGGLLFRVRFNDPSKNDIVIEANSHSLTSGKVIKEISREEAFNF